MPRSPILGGPSKAGQKMDPGTSLVVQRLRLHPPNAGGVGSIPVQKTRSYMPQLRVCMSQLKTPHAATKTQSSQIKIKIKKIRGTCTKSRRQVKRWSSPSGLWCLIWLWTVALLTPANSHSPLPLCSSSQQQVLLTTSNASSPEKRDRRDGSLTVIAFRDSSVWVTHWVFSASQSSLQAWTCPPMIPLPEPHFPMSSHNWVTCNFYHGFPGDSDSKESACKRRLGFDPWVRKITWRREWVPTPVFLPGEFHEQRILEGYSPWHCKEGLTQFLS